MRIRTIKPAFWTSPDIAALPDDTHRLLFIGLWNYVDDSGRERDDPRIIKGAIFPLNDAIRAADVDDMLWRLPSVLRYSVDERFYLAISTWSEHQKVNHPTPSRMPPPTDGIIRVRATGTLLESSRWEVEGKGREGNREGNGLEAAPRSVDNNPNQPSDDQLFLGDRLGLSIPAIVRLNKAHGRQHVEDAMRQAHGFPPEGGIGDPYPFVDSVASFKKAGVA